MWFEAFGMPQKAHRRFFPALDDAVDPFKLKAGVIRTSFFGLGLYGILPCVSRIEQVHDVVGVCLPLAWFSCE